MRILVVEDDQAIAEMTAMTLRREGFVTEVVGDVESARQLLASSPPDLILLDWMLPDQSGLEFARSLRRDESFGEIPIIMLTARGEESDKLLGLRASDDYVTKPFSPRELVARIRAVLRRSGTAGGERLMAGQLEIDLAAYEVRIHNNPIMLAPAEYRLLVFLMRNSGRVFSRRQLLDRVWGQNVFIEERTVDVHIRRLRRALSPYGQADCVATVRGAGYRFSPLTGE